MIIGTFTVEEINLVAMYLGGTRTETLNNIAEALPDIYDEDIISIAESASRKLAMLEDTEYAESYFIPADDTDE